MKKIDSRTISSKRRNSTLLTLSNLMLKRKIFSSMKKFCSTLWSLTQVFQSTQNLTLLNGYSFLNFIGSWSERRSVCLQNDHGAEHIGKFQQSPLDYFSFLLLIFLPMKYISFGSILFASSINIKAHTHFEENLFTNKIYKRCGVLSLFYSKSCKIKNFKLKFGNNQFCTQTNT